MQSTDWILTRIVSTVTNNTLIRVVFKPILLPVPIPVAVAALILARIVRLQPPTEDQ